LAEEFDKKTIGFKPGEGMVGGVGSIVLFNSSRNVKHVYE